MQVCTLPVMQCLQREFSVFRSEQERLGTATALCSAHVWMVTWRVLQLVTPTLGPDISSITLCGSVSWRLRVVTSWRQFHWLLAENHRMRLIAACLCRLRGRLLLLLFLCVSFLIGTFLGFCSLHCGCVSKGGECMCYVPCISLQSLQSSSLRELEESLREHSVTLTVQYSDTLHDREVRYIVSGEKIYGRAKQIMHGFGIFIADRLHSCMYTQSRLCRFLPSHCGCYCLSFVPPFFISTLCLRLILSCIVASAWFSMYNKCCDFPAVFRFSNGWIVRLGRGLDYFQRPKARTFYLVTVLSLPYYTMYMYNLFFLQGQFTIGSDDFDQRPCHETTIEIYHRLNVKSVKT